MREEMKKMRLESILYSNHHELKIKKNTQLFSSLLNWGAKNL